MANRQQRRYHVWTERDQVGRDAWLQAMRYSMANPFSSPEVSDAHVLAVALASAMHRPHDSATLQFNPNARLDTSFIQDKRGPQYLHDPELFRHMLAANLNPTDITDRRLERPAPRFDPRIGAAGQHNAEDARKRLKKAGKHGAFKGDGRLERPAPKSTKHASAAGNAKSQPVRKTKPRFNQGRHDA